MVLPVAIIQLYRAIKHILNVRFYTSQGKEANLIVCPNQIPGLGVFVEVIKANIKSWREGGIENPVTVLLKQNCPMTPCNFLICGADYPGVIVCDVKVVEVMYTTKNKYFDKHSLI